MELTNHTKEIQTPQKYTLRKLITADLFTMSKIISKIGISQMKNCLHSEGVAELLNTMKTEDKIDKNSINKNDKVVYQVGIEVVLEIANIIISKLSTCEEELYDFLANLSGTDKETIRTLDIAIFLEMVIDVVKKEEFVSFTQVAFKLFK